MLKTRVIPCLLLRRGALVKTVRFKDASYVGDPINTIRIFNEKEVDELVLLDITATKERRKPSFDLIEDVASECFMPVAYGGGITHVDDAKRIIGLGIEKVVVNTAAERNPRLVTELAKVSGSQSVVVSIDAKKTLLRGYKVCFEGGTRATNLDPADWARQVVDRGAGELLITSIDRDGTFKGYDVDLVRAVSAAVRVPVIACGGAGKLEHLTTAVRQGGADAVAMGSMVVYQGEHRAVLINFPSRQQIERALG